MRYLGLTIGPIYKTLTNAKKTREIWGASYFFSYIIKQIIKKLLNKDVKENDFITPYINKDKLELQNGVGLFHDRMIFKSKNLDKKGFEKIIDEVLEDIEKDSDDYLDFEFLKNYLQIHIIELKEEFSNPIIDISPYLDTAELMFQTQSDSENKILDFVRNRLIDSFLAKDAFGDKEARFPSLPKIALKSFIENEMDENIDEQEFMEELIRKYSENIKPYNKYIAIVQADGDNMGKVIQQIGNDNNKLRSFSQALFDFCIEATEKVEDSFGGRMIYAGGDDLLFFAPVAKNEETIFELLNNIDRIFYEKIQPIIENLKLEKKPSLSFGLSITYYKFPLYEARENAVNLLFGVAKNNPKNQIGYKVIKHSGRSFESVINKDKLFDDFLQLIRLDEDMDENFLHSIYIKINKYKTVLDSIAMEEDIQTKLKNFFDNNFNEDEHKKYRDFFEKLISFMIKVYKSDIKDKTNFIYSALRFKKFLLGDKD